MVAGKVWSKVKKGTGWLLLLVVIAIGGSIGKHIGHELMEPSDREILAKVLAAAVPKLNAKAPQQLDAITRLDRAEAINDHTIRLYHTLLNYPAYAADFDMHRVQAVVTKNLCASQNKDSPLRFGLVWEYLYLQESGSEVGRFNITRKDCPGI